MSIPTTHEFLTRLVEELVLLESDRKKLYARGFNDDTIARCRYRSCHPGNGAVIQKLVKEWGAENFLAKKLVTLSPNVEHGIIVNRQLLDSNILIPYIDAKGEVTKIRPHKFGFPGSGVTVYRTALSYQQISVCIIAESEFKAEAAAQLGFPAISIPGISSMIGKYWEDFIAEVDAIDATKFIVCFDNEIKDDPKLPNFKADWRSRYDTSIYAYGVCQRILNAGKNCSVAVLPPEWMVDGKIDIDAALAAGHGQDEFQRVFTEALPPKKFYDSLKIPFEHQSYVNRRLKRLFFNSKIAVTGNCFWMKDKDGKPDRKLMNCWIRIKNIYEEFGTDNVGLRRDIIIVDEYGLESQNYPIHAAHMNSRSAFSQWLMSQGNYIFYGKDQDIPMIWEYVFNMDDADTVYLLDYCGWNPDQKFFIFKNCLIKDDYVLKSDELGVSWLDQIGYKPNPLSDSMKLPLLQEEGDFDLDQFAEWLGDTVENKGMAKAMLSWVLAVMFLNPIASVYHMFPLLFLYGTRSGGKTTIMRWLASFFGIEVEAVNLSTSTPVGVNRLLSYYSGLPVIVDDWRDDVQFKKYVTSFLGVYNRQSGAKGIRQRFGLQSTEIRGALAIMGEEMISDNGLATRCLSFYIPKDRRVDRLQEIDTIIGNASAFTMNTLTKGYKEKTQKVMSEIRDAADLIKKTCKKVDNRVVFNHAILLGAWRGINGTRKQDDDLLAYVTAAVSEGHKELERGDKIHKFAEEFSSGVAFGVIQSYHFNYNEGQTHIYLWLKGIIDAMNKFYTRNHTDQSQLLVKHLRQQPYFVRAVKQTFKGVPGVLPALELDLTKMSDFLRGCFQTPLIKLQKEKEEVA